MYLPSSSSTTNGQVPLSAIVHIKEQHTGPLLITHFGQLPATTISFNTAPGVSLGAAVDAIEQAEKEVGLPTSFITAFQGTAAAFQSSLTNEVFLIIAAVVAMYIVLGVLYESFIHPITILSTLPSAGVGALLVADAAPLRPRRHRHHRHHPVDRHRQEERDHDDRLRARGRAQRGPAAARGNLSGLPAALPADHDDHDGRDPRRAAADARDRHRLGAAPAARHRHRRRADRQPDAHACSPRRSSISISIAWRCGSPDADPTVPLAPGEIPEPGE